MSLLLEALKKAEWDQSKTGWPSAPGGSISGTKASAAAPDHPPGEALEFLPEDTPAPPPHACRQPDDPASHSSAARMAAQNLFTAKQGSDGGTYPGKWLAFIGAALVIVTGGAYYVWRETARLAPAGLAPAPAQAATAAPAEPAPAGAVPVVTSVAPSAAKEAAGTAIALRSATALPSQSPVAGGRKAVRHGGVDEKPAGSSAAPAISIQATHSANAIPPMLAAAYQAYVAGDLTTARQHYLQHLQTEPDNRDALLGLAAAAIHLRLPGEAKTCYLRALELDPRDPAAIAGLVGLGQQTDAGLLESRLKILLVQQPDAAALHFTLGNHYASQSRWAESQQAFFRAFSLDSANADYAFNLAISLDRLSQSRLAAEYYRRALALDGAAPASFDRTQAAARLKEIGG